MKAMFMFLCAFAFVVVVPLDSSAKMVGKPTIQGSYGYSCSGNTCSCKGVNDCEVLVDSGKCDGPLSCSDNGCTCSHFEPVPLNKKTMKRFQDFQK